MSSYFSLFQLLQLMLMLTLLQSSNAPVYRVHVMYVCRLLPVTTVCCFHSWLSNLYIDPKLSDISRISVVVHVSHHTDDGKL